jgi:tetratricopeptide (TPR) repeat protein
MKKNIVLFALLFFATIPESAQVFSGCSSCSPGCPSACPHRGGIDHDGPNNNKPTPPSAKQLRERAFVQAYNEGNAAYRAGNYDGALDKYAVAHKLNPDDNDTRFMIGSTTYMLGNYDFIARNWFKTVGGKRKGEAKELINKIEARLRANGWILYGDGTAWRTVWDNSVNQNVCEQADKEGNVSRIACHH